MKNKNIQTSLFSLVIILSMCCCIFINTLSSSNLDLNSEIPKEEIKAGEIILESETSLSDVKIVKTAIELLKNMTPSLGNN